MTMPCRTMSTGVGCAGVEGPKEPMNWSEALGRRSASATVEGQPCCWSCSASACASRAPPWACSAEGKGPLIALRCCAAIRAFCVAFRLLYLQGVKGGFEDCRAAEVAGADGAADDLAATARTDVLGAFLDLSYVRADCQVRMAEAADAARWRLVRHGIPRRRLAELRACPAR